MTRAAPASIDFGARHALREATRDVHERLHRHPGFMAMLDGTLTRSGYRKLLASLYGFHRPLEDALLAAPRPWWHGLEPEPRRRAHRLADDLRALGLTPPELAALPHAPVPAVTCPSALLGCLYVREGATLGGRVLARKLETLCGPSGGRSFFAGTPDDAARWAELCVTLDATINERHLATMINAASATFASFEAWLTCGMISEERGNLP